jgi:peptidoglycan-associated lipoprotein
VESEVRKIKMMRRRLNSVVVVMFIAAVAGAGCKKPVAKTPQPAPTAVEPAVPTTPPAPPPQRVEDTAPVPQPRLAEDGLVNRSLDDLNRDSPLKPVFFGLDSADLDDAGRTVATANASVLKKYGTWTITVEGHCDERGTAEYNLALGERRAVAVKTYLSSLGVSPDRIRTVSYGKEFPFDMAHNEDAWSANRRGHFVITAK